MAVGVADNPECPQCGGHSTRPVVYDDSERTTGYRDYGVVQECRDCGERF